MNKVIQNFISLFGGQTHEFKLINEGYRDLKIQVEISKFQIPNQELFFDALGNLNKRDYIHLKVKNSDEDETVIETVNEDFDFEKFKELINPFKNSFCEFNLNVVKRNMDNTISIYYVDNFIEYLNSLTFNFFLSAIANSLNQNNSILFEIQDQESQIEIITSSIAISKNRVSFKNIIDERSRRNNLIKNICHSNLSNKFNFIPEDFYPINLSSNNNLNNLFKQISTIYSLIYLFDIVNVDENNLYFKLNGYKTINKNFTVSSISVESYKTYFKIYDWVYTGGGIIDKIGLARNIISLNIGIDNLQLSDNTYNSIQSGYKIYQKENINQYIEIRNKISDQLIEIQKNADKIVDDFVGDFRKSLFTFVSFFASVFVLKVVSTGNIGGGFSKEVTLLSIGFLLVALVVMLFRKNEIKTQKERYQTYYNNLKERYTDLLDKGDISRILNEDKDFNNNLKYINERINRYTKIWVSAIIIFLIIAILLYLPNSYLFEKCNFYTGLKILLNAL